MNRRKMCSLLAGAGVVGALPGCARPHSRTVALGLVFNETGAQRELDGPSLRGARLAIREINDSGGVLGLPVDGISVDGRTDADVLAERTAALLDSHPSTSALLGLSDTDMVRAAAAPAAARGRAFVTSGATSPRLPEAAPGYLFLACFGDNVQAAAAAEWAYDALRARTAVVLFDRSMSYTRLLQGYFRTRFEELGGRILESREFQSGDLESATANVPACDMIFLSSGPDDAVAMSAELRAQGATAPIVGGDGLDVEDGWRAAPTLSGVYFTTHIYLGDDNDDPAIAAFRAAYRAAYPSLEPDAFAALGYDATRLVIAAIGAAASAEPEAVRDAIAATSEFHGVTGTITYVDGGAVPQKSVSIVKIENGERRFVTRLTPEAPPPP